jgi:flagellar motor switch protein FliN/FliY
MADQNTEHKSSTEPTQSAQDPHRGAPGKQPPGEVSVQAETHESARPEGTSGAEDTGQDQAFQRAEFKDLDADSLPQDQGEPQLDMILDIPVTIALEIGRTQVSIRNLLQLNQGSIVELDRLAGEPLDVLVNGTLIAHGEVVMVNEKFGIRLTDVISTAERVQNLQ